MSNAIQSFEQQKRQALNILSSLAAFVQEGRERWRMPWIRSSKSP